MSTAIITTIKNGTITLPKKVQTVILKKVYRTDTIFDEETVGKLKAVGKQVSSQDIDKVIRLVRSPSQNKRA